MPIRVFRSSSCHLFPASTKGNQKYRYDGLYEIVKVGFYGNEANRETLTVPSLAESKVGRVYNFYLVRLPKGSSSLENAIDEAEVLSQSVTKGTMAAEPDVVETTRMNCLRSARANNRKKSKSSGTEPDKASDQNRPRKRKEIHRNTASSKRHHRRQSPQAFAEATPTEMLNEGTVGVTQTHLVGLPQHSHSTIFFPSAPLAQPPTLWDILNERANSNGRVSGPLFSVALDNLATGEAPYYGYNANNSNVRSWN